MNNENIYSQVCNILSRKSKLKNESVTRPVLDEVLSNREIFTYEPGALFDRINDQLN